MDEIIDHYKILDLESNCTNEEIKQKFRQLALKYHPDKLNQQQSNQQSIDKKFKQIETAYRILINDESRRKFDAEFSFMKSNLPIINEQVKIDEFIEVVDQLNDAQTIPFYEYNCRCGGYYRLTKDQYLETLNKFNENLIASLMISCDTCSLYIRIIKE